MSIVSKVFFLFLTSLFLMLFVSSKTEKLTQKTLESLLTQKYIHVSDELFTLFSNSDLESLKKKLHTLAFEVVQKDEAASTLYTVVYAHKTPLSQIQILKDPQKHLLLSLKYLDDEILLKEMTQDKNFQEMAFLSYLILADILILVGFLLVILKMIYPLKRIVKDIEKFGKGEYAHRIEVHSKDEIAEVAQTFNAMAGNIEELILSRQRLLRDIGHELKTPLSKSKIALEMIEASKYKTILQQALNHVDEMVDELLDLEKLNANQSKFTFSTFHVETLIGNALSRLLVEDETLIEIKIEDNFMIEADLKYLTIALKNLIDNALKYSDEKPVYIECKEGTVYVKSKGSELEKPLSYYCDLFTQGDNSRGEKGYGLGLSIVKMVVDKHAFKLFYLYEEGYNLFGLQMIMDKEDNLSP